MGASMDKVRADADARRKAFEAFWGDGGVTPAGDGISGAVWDERCRQIGKFGSQTLPSGTSSATWADAELVAKKACAMGAVLGTLTWVDVLGEEMAEAFASEDPEALRAELVQVAAVAAAWIQDLDSKKPDDLPTL